MSPWPYFALVMLFSESVYFAFEVMTALTLFAKIMPPHIESSMFALVTGILNFSYWFLARFLGNFVNLFFGVNKNDLDDTYKLFLV